MILGLKKSAASGSQWSQQIPAPTFFLGSGILQYCGASLAVMLFASLNPLLVVWGRTAVAGIILTLWRRPWRLVLTRRDWMVSGAFGLNILAMNTFFYEAIARINLGTAVSLEFLGPVLVAVTIGRGWRVRAAALLGLIGVCSIGGLALNWRAPDTLAGVIFAIAAGACWAAYIVIGQKVAARRSSIDSLAIGTICAAVLTVPIVAPWLGALFGQWHFVVLVLGVGVLSTALPYAVEAVALGRMGPDKYALLTSLMPLMSVLVAMVTLGQLPTVGDIVGMAAISTAVALASYVPPPPKMRNGRWPRARN